MADEQRPEQPRKFVTLLARWSSIIVLLPSSMLAGFLIGYGLDRWIGTSPWMRIVFLLLGSVAGFYRIFDMLRKD